MSIANNRRGQSRSFDTEKARRPAQRNTAIVKPYPKNSTRFMDASRIKRVNSEEEQIGVDQRRSCDSSSSSSSKTSKYAPQLSRLHAGQNNPNVRKVRNVITSPSECTKKAPGFDIRPPCPKVHFSEVRLSHNIAANEKQRYLTCQQFMSKLEVRMHKTRGTQSLYRESSAQTLPYLPSVANKKNELEGLELFKLTTILPGDGPPGVYEVEVLERARKRWAFANEIKITFRRQLESAAERRKLHQHKSMLEAFEWQRWMEREEYIIECQMIRLELLVGMLNKREEIMHKASKLRIEQSHKEIAARRDAALRKNEVEYGREMRQLIFTRDRVPRRWRRESIVHLLGSPNSDYYGPQQRYGVNPACLHFTPKRKEFENRMDDLGKRAIETAKLVCPYAKLREWSKPKPRFLEIERNFTSDGNLNHMYNDLTTLRKGSRKVKSTPKCLVRKRETQEIKPLLRHERSVDSAVLAEPQLASESVDDRELQRQRDEEFRLNVQKKRQYIEFIQSQHISEETDTLLSEYEGSTIGWLMRFLSEELSRKQEQHILSYLALLARKERWRREAAEVGLRQKENEMREIYDQLYTQTHQATGEICREFLNTFLIEDIPDYTDFLATKVISDLTTTIDMDTGRWLESIACIQNPLNFDKLRRRLKDFMFPELENIMKKKEVKFVTDYIIKDVVLQNVFQLLEPFDIGCFTSNETVDRVTDNDLYYFSSEENSSTCSSECGEGEREARAILRKAIRRSVPGRRWKYPNERIALNTTYDILDDVIEETQRNGTIFGETDGKYFRELSSAPSLSDIFNPKTRTPVDLPDRRLTNERIIKIVESENYKLEVIKALKKRKNCEHENKKEEEQNADECVEEESSMSLIQAIIEDIGGLVEDDEISEESESEVKSADGSALRLILKQVYKVINPSEEDESEESFVDDEDEGDEEGVNSPSSFDYQSILYTEPPETSSDEVMLLENDGQILTYMPLPSSKEQSGITHISNVSPEAEDQTGEVREGELTPRAAENDEPNTVPAADILPGVEVMPEAETIPEDMLTIEAKPETETDPGTESSPEAEDAPVARTMLEAEITPKVEAMPATDITDESEALAAAETIPETETLLAALEEETGQETKIEIPNTEQQPDGVPKVESADDAEEESITEIKQSFEAFGAETAALPDDIEQAGQPDIAKREESETSVQQELPAGTERITEAGLPTQGIEAAETAETPQ